MYLTETPEQTVLNEKSECNEYKFVSIMKIVLYMCVKYVFKIKKPMTCIYK